MGGYASVPVAWVREAVKKMKTPQPKKPEKK
jgi:hypothetical protein